MLRFTSFNRVISLTKNLSIINSNIILYVFVFVSAAGQVLVYYTLRFYFPYLSLLAQPVNIIQLMTFHKVDTDLSTPWK